MIIALMGYMGSGKSFVGKKLAKALKYDFIDLDAYIEAQEQKTIKEIFKTKGEIYFRTIESAYVKQLVESTKDCVLALGGGTPCYANTMQFLLDQDHVKTVYLQVAIPVIAERLQQEVSLRPLISHLTSKEALIEFIGKHLFERLQFYNQASHTVNANDEPDTIVEAIIFELF